MLLFGSFWKHSVCDKSCKVKCLTNQALCHEDVWGSVCIDPHFLDLGTSWRWVVSFTLRSLCARRKGPWYPLDRRLGGPQSRSGRCGEEKILYPVIPIELSWLTISHVLYQFIECFNHVILHSIYVLLSDICTSVLWLLYWLNYSSTTNLQIKLKFQ
jgi:hypothetical protein